MAIARQDSSRVEAHYTQHTLHLLETFFRPNGSPLVGVRLWDGTRWPDETPFPVTIVLKHPGALRSMFLPGTQLALAEAYLYDDYDIEGDIERVFQLADLLSKATAGWSKKFRVANSLRQLPTVRRTLHGRGPARLNGYPHSLERDRQAIAYHYNVSNDFYRLWLDSHMVYTCAYVATPEEELDSAQLRKLDYVCRKLRLKPGQKLLDIGCGWGALLLHAAQQYGVEVTGVTLSQPQAELAKERIAAAGLTDRAQVYLSDYREFTTTGCYDAVSSIEMYEAVGKAQLPVYFAHAHRFLKPGGVFLNQGIHIGVQDIKAKGPIFSEAYIFPDGELVGFPDFLQTAEESGFEIRDIESMREHYILTLRHWLRGLEARYAEARHYVDEPTYRAWRLYLSGSAHGFKTNQFTVYQTLLVKPDHQGQSHLPLTRSDWSSPRLQEASDR